MKKSLHAFRILSVLGILLLFCLMLFPTANVDAVESNNTVVLGSMDASYADKDLKAYLAENGINIEPGDIISLVRNSSNVRSSTTNELKVVQQDSSDVITVHTLIGYDEDQNGTAPADVPIDATNGRLTKSLSFNYKSNTITLTVSATYTIDHITIDGYDRAAYRPLSSSFMYTRSSSANVTVTSIDTSFITSGALYSLTTNSITSDSYSYTIENTQYDPVASKWYPKSRNMTSNLRIIYTNGGWNEGPWMSYLIKFSDGTSGMQDVSMIDG